MADNDHSMSESEVRRLIERFRARANSIIMRDQPEQQRDLRLAARWMEEKLEDRRGVS
jgi:hypothetical protein